MAKAKTILTQKSVDIAIASLTSSGKKVNASAIAKFLNAPLPTVYAYRQKGLISFPVAESKKTRKLKAPKISTATIDQPPVGDDSGLDWTDDELQEDILNLMSPEETTQSETIAHTYLDFLLDSFRDGKEHSIEELRLDATDLIEQFSYKHFYQSFDYIKNQNFIKKVGESDKYISTTESSVQAATENVLLQDSEKEVLLEKRREPIQKEELKQKSVYYSAPEPQKPQDDWKDYGDSFCVYLPLSNGDKARFDVWSYTSEIIAEEDAILLSIYQQNLERQKVCTLSQIGIELPSGAYLSIDARASSSESLCETFSFFITYVDNLRKLSKQYKNRMNKIQGE